MKIYLLKFTMPNDVTNYGVIAYATYEEAYTAGMKCLMMLEENSSFEVISFKEKE